MRQYAAFGRELRAARERADLTPAEAARAARVTASYWRFMEQGARRPSAEVLTRVCHAVRCDYPLLARLIGYAPEEGMGQTVVVDTIEMAAWLRQFAETFSVEEMAALYDMGRAWVPRALVEPSVDRHSA